MAETVDHNHHHDHVAYHDRGDMGASWGLGWFVALIILLVVLALLFFYGLPALRSSGPSISIPDKIDVNVN